MALDGSLRVQVTTEQLKGQAGEVKTIVGEMEKKFEALKNSVNGMSSYWTGEAGEKHRKEYLNYISTIEEILARYTEHVKDLETMVGIYTQADAKAKKIGEALPISTL